MTLVFVRRNYVARVKYCRPPTALREIQRICKSSTFNTFSNSIYVHALVVLMGVVHSCCPPWVRKGSIIGNCVLLFSLKINREKLHTASCLRERSCLTGDKNYLLPPHISYLALRRLNLGKCKKTLYLKFVICCLLSSFCLFTDLYCFETVRWGREGILVFLSFWEK